VIDPNVLASDAAIGLGVGIPVVVVAAGVAVGFGLRRRGKGASSADAAEDSPPSGSSAGSSTTAVLEREPGAATTEAPARGPAVAEPQAPTAAPAEAEVAPAPEVATEPEPEPEVVEAPTYRGRLGKARNLLSGYIGAVRSRGKIDATTWDDLEEALIRADVGVGATDALLDDLRGRVKSEKITSPDALVDALKADLVDMLSSNDAALALPTGAPSSAIDADGDSGADRPPDGESDGKSVDVWLFVGVNGVGKTTTVGKVASRLSSNGTRVLLAAGDTFRAAAGEQLEMWASRAHAEIVRGAEGGDPSSVVFDAVQRAASRGYQIVLADTAGRLHNKVNLVEELKKIRRVSGRPPGKVVEVLLVLDATTGQNGLAQAKVFLDAVDVSGVVLTKLDGTAKGGIVVAIQRELGLPVKLVGLGEGVGDLIDFDPESFVDALF
jgi:fused signal recognition particle receptor